MNTSSWFPVRRFTKSPVGKDWMMGATKFVNCTDCLDPKHKIRKYETVLWNRSKGNLCMSVESYRKAVREKDPKVMEFLAKVELPTDVYV